MKKPIFMIIVAVIVLGGGFLLFRMVGTNSSSTSKNDAQSTASTTQQASATITFSNSGFTPSKTTVKSGDTVAIKNTSSSDVQMESDPHPAHTDDTDLNVGLVNPGQTKTFTVTKTGTFGFHNHLNPSDTGRITIQ